MLEFSCDWVDTRTYCAIDDVVDANPNETPTVVEFREDIMAVKPVLYSVETSVDVNARVLGMSVLRVDR